MLKKFRISKLKQFLKNFSTTNQIIKPTTAKTNQLVKREKLQFSKQKLSEFGELPQGEIPEALLFDRINSKIKLSIIKL